MAAPTMVPLRYDMPRKITTSPAEPMNAPPTSPSGEPMTPMGVQSKAELARRRRIAFRVNGAIYVALLVWLASILGADGWSLIDVLIFLCFAVAAPWSVLGV